MLCCRTSSPANEGERTRPNQSGCEFSNHRSRALRRMNVSKPRPSPVHAANTLKSAFSSIYTLLRLYGKRRKPNFCRLAEAECQSSRNRPLIRAFVGRARHRPEPARNRRDHRPLRLAPRICVRHWPPPCRASFVSVNFHFGIAWFARPRLAKAIIEAQLRIRRPDLGIPSRRLPSTVSSSRVHSVEATRFPRNRRATCLDAVNPRKRPPGKFPQHLRPSETRPCARAPA